MTDTTHGGLMDQVYRRQRHIYDATRKYYLLGRDYALAQMQPGPHDHILEVACGTGRNLDQIARRYPGRPLYGMDISAQMLRSAEAKLAGRALLAHGDACDFDPKGLFGRHGFDRILLSYSVSMIPDWQAALSQAARHLAPGGELHVVDFGDQSRLPRWFDQGLRRWLGQFHVTPRDTLQEAMASLPGGTVTTRPLLRSYAVYGCFRKDA